MATIQQRPSKGMKLDEFRALVMGEEIEILHFFEPRFGKTMYLLYHDPSPGCARFTFSKSAAERFKKAIEQYNPPGSRYDTIAESILNLSRNLYNDEMAHHYWVGNDNALSKRETGKYKTTSKPKSKVFT